MNLQELQDSGKILISAICGSHAYGTNIVTSDVDLRGIYYVNPQEYLGLSIPKEQINDDKHDIVYWNLKRYIELATKANPSVLELLWIPEDCIKTINHDIMDDMIAERDLFITNQAYFSHSRYALSQIKKSRGQNKRVHNPCPKERPVKEDFCRVILLDNLNTMFIDMPEGGLPSENNGWTYKGLFPFRPVPLKDTELDLSEYHVASLEHAHNIYRLYHYRNYAKGVFRGDDMLVCESIPKEDEWAKIEGLLIYDKNEYDKAVKEWSAYWNWMKSRNEARWIDQENGKLNYDQKNLMHCIRLMLSAKNILQEGEPIVRFEGDELAYLKKIRAGEFEYEEIMERANKIEKEIDVLFAASTLPERPDKDKLDKLYRHLMSKGKRNFS